MNEKNDDFFRFSPQDVEPRFPEKIEYVISADEALKEIRTALEKINNFRNQRLYLFRTLFAPLVPETVRNKVQRFSLEDYSIAYGSLIGGIGNFISALVLFNFDDHADSVKENYRLVILPYLELKFKQKIDQLEKNRPFGWKIARKFYQRNLDDLKPLVDNLIHLIALAWTFCPAIGEPEKETGFFNRFVFTCNGGFIDLGHYFNCAIIAYLYGCEKARCRAEATENQQRALRNKRWLVRLREKNLFRLITNLLWGYATSADTIEDRASDKLGILLGSQIRDFQDNSKMIDYYVDLYPKLVRRTSRLFGEKSKILRMLNTISIFFKNLFYTSSTSEIFDIENYMKNFFEEYDAVDPRDSSQMPDQLLKGIIDFYTEKYVSEDWDHYTCKEWCAVIPQELWEKVVRGRKKFQEKDIPIRIQLKDSGKLVEPYNEDTPYVDER